MQGSKRKRPAGAAACAWCDCPFQAPFVFPAEAASLNAPGEQRAFCSAECALAHVTRMYPNAARRIHAAMQRDGGRPIFPAAPFMLSTAWGGEIPPEDLKWVARNALTQEQRAAAAAEDEFHLGTRRAPRHARPIHETPGATH